MRHVNTLPATEADISTTIGTPQLAKAPVEGGPVIHVLIEFERDAASRDGFRWPLFGGSDVIPVREGLTAESHAYVEQRTLLSYLLPSLRSITGGYRSRAIDRQWQLMLEQPGAAG